MPHSHREDFIHLHRMTKEEAQQLNLSYEFIDSPFGNLAIAASKTGICYLGFADSETETREELKKRFPSAAYEKKDHPYLHLTAQYFTTGLQPHGMIDLHLKATDFQFKVWQSLSRIPLSDVTTYSAIAEDIGTPRAVRAVGTAIGRNPISVLIPCHRVIRQNGDLGGYYWGLPRKKAILKWEKSQ